MFAKRDDALAHGIGFGGGARSFGGGEEEGSLGVFSEFGAQDAKATGGIAEAPCGLGRGEALDEIGAKGFVLALFWSTGVLE